MLKRAIAAAYAKLLYHQKNEIQSNPDYQALERKLVAEGWFYRSTGNNIVKGKVQPQLLFNKSMALGPTSRFTYEQDFEDPKHDTDAKGRVIVDVRKKEKSDRNPPDIFGKAQLSNIEKLPIEVVGSSEPTPQ